MIIAGIDEAGRGPLAGDVVAAVVVIPKDVNIKGLTDSKKITASKRNKLYEKIILSCHYAIGSANVVEIDKLNIFQATLLAMRRALDNLNIDYDKVLVDGTHCPIAENCQAIIKGDLTEDVISAASIVAKVTRDKQMEVLDRKYPNYSFKQHKGYATKGHIEALYKYGVIKGVHRLSYAPVKKAKECCEM